MVMRNVDDALKLLQASLPGLVVKTYTKTGDNTFEMVLEMSGKVLRSEGHIDRLRRIDTAFIEKVRAAFPS
jgi:hypothetical protein